MGKSKKKKGKNSFLSYLTSRSFWTNVLLAAGITVVSFIILFFVLKGITRHGKEFEIPNYVGKTIDEVNAFPASEDLEFLIYDSVFSPDQVGGTILSQLPPATSMVKKGRKVYLTIVSITPEMVKMPDLVNISLRQSQSLLETYGLEIGSVTRVPAFDHDAVQKQSMDGVIISPGTEIPKGSFIDLVVGENNDVNTLVPNLIGKSKREALSIIEQKDFQLGTAKFDPGCDTTDAIIYMQSPSYESDKYVNQGSIIDIWLGKE